MSVNRSTRVITLTFETPEDAESWLGWYIDGGGEQICDYYASWDGPSGTGNIRHLFLRNVRENDA